MGLVKYNPKPLHLRGADQLMWLNGCCEAPKILLVYAQLQ